MSSSLNSDAADELRQRWGILAAAGVVIVAWCAAVLATGAHLRARDNVFAAVYYGGLVTLLVYAATRARRRRRRASERRALVARLAAQDPADPAGADVVPAR